MTTKNVSLDAPLHTQTKGGVLSESNMKWYFGGQLVSIIGSFLQGAVISLLIVTITSKAEAATWVTLVWALGFIPGMVLGPFMGTILDRHDKRKILIWCQVLGAVQASILMCLSFSGHINMFWLTTLSFLMGLVNAIDGPGRTAILKESIIDQSNLRSASKMFMSLYSLAQIAGPGCAGYLVITFGYACTFLLNALSFVVLIIALAKMKIVIESHDHNTGTHQHGVLKHTIESGKYIFAQRSLCVGIFLSTGICVFGFSYTVLFVVINKYMLHGSEISYSHLTASSGLGSLTGAVCTHFIGRRMLHKHFVTLFMCITGIAILCLSQVTHNMSAMICVYFASMGCMASISTVRASVQHHTKQSAQGAIVGYSSMFAYGGMMISSLLIGACANHFGLPTVIATVGILMLCLTFMTPFLPGIDELE